MYKAVGYYSQNEYMVGQSVAEVMRLLQKAYPNPKRGAITSKGSTSGLYGEPLKIVDETGYDKQYSKTF